MCSCATARLYLDVGSHPEYATAECDNLIQLVTHDRAGERVLEDLLIDAEQRLADEGIGGDIYLFKNNTDSAGNSYGCHENYLIARPGEFSRLAEALLPFLITRQLLVGAGTVLDAETARAAGISFALFTEGYRKTPISDLPHDFAFSDFAVLSEYAALKLASDPAA